jgi:DNA-binding Lrp family transcriptional regulator
LVAALLADGRASFADLGLALNLSASAVKRRVDRLRDAGVLLGFTAVVDPGALGWRTEAFVEVHCEGKVAPGSLRASLERLPEVVGAYTVSGPADALVHLFAEDTTHLEAALERLRADSGVRYTSSAIVLARLIDRRRS